MPGATPSLLRRANLHGVARTLLMIATLLCAGVSHGEDAATLRTRAAALHDLLADNAFRRPLVLDSVQAEGTLTGDVYATVSQPYSVVRPALQGMDHWCDILMLHLNVKICTQQGTGKNSVLSVAVGRKANQPLEDAYRLAFGYRVAVDRPDYLEVRLNAAVGPLNTRDYHIALSAIPLDARHSFVHLSYSYAYGFAAGVAMQGYLMTIGRNKVGFSVVAHDAGGLPVYVAGMLGVIERNTMRYYLAVEVYLAAYTLPPGQQSERRLRDWFIAIEGYPRQLHELKREEYMTMKQMEITRQRAARPS